MLGNSQRKRKANDTSDDVVKALAIEASDNGIDWDNVAPVYFTNWLEMFARAHGVVKDIMYMAILPRIAGLLGSQTCLKLSEGHRESMGCFILCLAPPDAAKSPANNHGGKIPMSYVERENNIRLSLDKFTEVGLRQHLIDNNGTAVIVKDEMYQTLRQILSEKEMGTLCRLYDGDSLFVTTGANAKPVGVDKTSIALGGFLQVKNFLADLYPQMSARQDGFDARFNIGMVRPEALTRKESANYEEVLRQSNLQDLNLLFNAIYCGHNGEDIAIHYYLDDEALVEFDDFDEQVCLQLNCNWQLGNLVTRATKERRHVLRWTVILYVTYQYTRRALFEAYGPISRKIPKRYVKYAIKLNEYFKKQKEIIEKHLTGGAVENTTKRMVKKVLDYDGPLVVTNLLRERFSSATRPTTTEVHESMETLQSESLGYVVKSGNTVAFLKEVPDRVEESSIERYGLSMDNYTKLFFKTNMDISNRLRERLIAHSEVASRILNAAEADEEEQ